MSSVLFFTSVSNIKLYFLTEFKNIIRVFHPLYFVILCAAHELYIDPKIVTKSDVLVFWMTWVPLLCIPFCILLPMVMMCLPACCTVSGELCVGCCSCLGSCCQGLGEMLCSCLSGGAECCGSCMDSICSGCAGCCKGIAGCVSGCCGGIIHLLAALWTAIVNFFWRGCCRAGIFRQTGLANAVDTPKSVLAGMWCGWAAVCCGYGPCRLLCCRSRSSDEGDVENQSNAEQFIPPAQQQDAPASGHMPVAPARPAQTHDQHLIPPGQQHATRPGPQLHKVSEGTKLYYVIVDEQGREFRAPIQE